MRGRAQQRLHFGVVDLAKIQIELADRIELQRRGEAHDLVGIRRHLIHRIDRGDGHGADKPFGSTGGLSGVYSARRRRIVASSVSTSRATYAALAPARSA